MMKSLAGAAQITHHHSFDATGILALRADFKKNGAEYGVGGVTLGDIILYAVSRIVKQNPEFNAHLLEGYILRKFRSVNLGVAIDTKRGLLVPTIFDAGRKNLRQISAEVKELAAAAGSGAISPDLLQGATFTVSNLGTTGVEMFTPIINPPQVAIIGVCGITTRVREKADGGIEAYPSMGLSITYDHRVIDGAPASRFAQKICMGLEHINLLLSNM
jgi:pyruvate dehydrogenase E2 component (dihydrolipoamide acetyltransferase)